ncbi:calcium/sodium antiporter [Desulfatiferula olefinivorans]
MDVIIWSFVLIISLAVLVIASDFLVIAAERIGVSFGLSHFVVGVIIVGFGTSLPELVSSALSVVRNHSEIVIGNVIGSNITNICLVLGVAGVVGKQFTIRYNLMNVDLPFLTGSALLLAFMIHDRQFTRIEAALCLMTLGAYLWGTFAVETADAHDDDVSGITPSPLKDWLMLLVSALLVFAGANYTVDAVIRISEIMKIGTEVIALSAVALGTSLPEVMIAVSAARKGKSDMVIGNIIGSNIFNTFAVMGLCGLPGNLLIPESILAFSLPFSVAVAFMYFVITKDQKINRSEGAILLISYVFFLVTLFGF